MSKQLSLFVQDKWWMEVVDSIPEEKKAQIISALKKLFIAAIENNDKKGENNGKR